MHAPRPSARPGARTAFVLLGLMAFLLGPRLLWGSRPEAGRRRTPVVEAVDVAAPAVVSVHADALSVGRVWRRGAGSGVILHPDGYVVTNSHVIQGAHRISVELFRAGGTYPARVVLSEPRLDLAVLKVDRPGGFRHAALAHSASALLGETAIAIGNPKGLGDTITVGVVSALDREARLSNGVVLRNLIQTDAPINTGNSGGALLNLDGEVLGVIVSLLPHSTGIAFAIPADDVRLVLQQALARTGSPSVAPRAPAPSPAPPPAPSPARASPPAAGAPDGAAPRPGSALPPPRVGGPGGTPAPDGLRPLGLQAADRGGAVVIASVTAPSPASRAGVRAGDVVLQVDGQVIERAADLAAALAGGGRSGPRRILVARQGAMRELLLLP